MFFSFFKNRRRAKTLAEPFPADWMTILQEQVGHYAVLSTSDQQKLRNAVQIMIAEKEWEGCRGLEITDAMRVTISAFAGILILGLDDYYFDDVEEVLVYPTSFEVKEEQSLGGSATLEGEIDALGESQHRGPVRLSWEEVSANSLQPGYGENLVFHEFAHKLDKLNGEMDGTPNLPTDALAKRWAKIMNDEYRKLQRAERRQQETLLDPYGATNPAEFFAVATECFFDAPQAMRQEYPPLYEIFREYFRQDPAAWPSFPQVQS